MRSGALRRRRNSHELKGPLKELCVILITGVGLAVLTAYIFYRSLMAFFLLLPPAILFSFLYLKERFRERREARLSSDFRDTISALSTYLSAGYSMENAFCEVYRERCAAGDRGDRMLRELSVIVKGIRLNKNIEELLRDFAEGSSNEDIKSFAFIFAITKRNGGDMREVIARTVSIIRDKAAVTEDMRTATRGVRYEQMVMTAIPFFMVFYINMSSGSFLDPLYEGATGRCVMTAALIMIGAAFLLSERLVRIDV